jgi:hypothetical protein
MRWLGLLLASLALWLFGQARQPAKAQQGRSASFGVLMLVPSLDELPKHVQALQASRVQWVGLDIPLSRINPREGVYDWDYRHFETTLRTLKAAGLRIVLKFLGLCCTNRLRKPFFPPRFLICPNTYSFSLLTPHHTTHPIPHLHHPVQNPYPHPYLTFPPFPTPCPYPIAKYPLQP